MKVIKTIDELFNECLKIRADGKILGLVPTMGFLHTGHTSLIEKANKDCDIVITTIFVNPRQFAPHEDFDSYPRDIDRDFNLAKDSGTDILFTPEQKEMYSANSETNVSVGRLAKVIEGEYRPHFFDGVATVVSKLFNATIPNLAYFGQKDYQQTLVVKKLVEDLNFPTKIIVADIAREENGLAKSSRNKYLTDEEFSKASLLNQTLNNTKQFIESGNIKDRTNINAFMDEQLKTLKDFNIDYARAARAKDLTEPSHFEAGENIVLLLAGTLGKTRLIDNKLVKIPS